LTARPDRIVVAAFAVFVLFAGTNAIAVRFVLREMGPFWSAAFRFALAGLILFGWLVVRRHPLPSGQRLLGTVLFGVLAFGLAYAFLYEALKDAPAGTTMLTLAVVPLLTVLLGAVQGIERLRWIGLAGAGLAAIGIVVIGGDQISLNVPFLALVLLLAAAVCQAESGLVAKRFPPGDPIAANAIGMMIGAAMLAAIAVVTGEPFRMPTRPETWLAMAYLIGPGSIAVFVFVLFILARWSASATSYAFLLFPMVAIVFGAILLGEPIQASFVIGGAIVLAGVYVGGIRRQGGSAEAPTSEAAPA
jgi:drug/metabolite transporter (DMT)-like permease